MSNLNCNCKSNCLSSAIALSLIVGIVTAILRFFTVISITPVFLWVLFGISTIYLLISPVISSIVSSNRIRNCIYPTTPALLVGLLGTVLTSLILLAIEFAATSVLGAITTGLLLAFFILILTSSACLTKCIAEISDYDEN